MAIGPAIQSVKPQILSNQLRGFENHYKIKLRASGYRLVYEVIDKKICILVIAISKRNKNKVYKQAKKKSDVNGH